jgi:Family of unknown function (DUF5681)
VVPVYAPADHPCSTRSVPFPGDPENMPGRIAAFWPYPPSSAILAFNCIFNPEQEHEPMTFQPGQSGNPGGKPRGRRNDVTVRIEKLLTGSAEEIAHRLVEKALEGDMVAIKMAIDRLSPARRDRPVNFPLPKLNSAADPAGALAKLAEAGAGGDLSPEEGANLAKLIEGYLRARERTDFEERIEALEQRMSDSGQ